MGNADNYIALFKAANSLSVDGEDFSDFLNSPKTALISDRQKGLKAAGDEVLPFTNKTAASISATTAGTREMLVEEGGRGADFWSLQGKLTEASFMAELDKLETKAPKAAAYFNQHPPRGSGRSTSTWSWGSSSMDGGPPTSSRARTAAFFLPVPRLPSACATRLPRSWLLSTSKPRRPRTPCSKARHSSPPYAEIHMKKPDGTLPRPSISSALEESIAMARQTNGQGTIERTCRLLQEDLHLWRVAAARHAVQACNCLCPLTTLGALSPMSLRSGLISDGTSAINAEEYIKATLGYRILPPQQGGPIL